MDDEILDPVDDIVWEIVRLSLDAHMNADWLIHSPVQRPEMSQT